MQVGIWSLFKQCNRYSITSVESLAMSQSPKNANQSSCLIFFSITCPPCNHPAVDTHYYIVLGNPMQDQYPTINYAFEVALEQTTPRLRHRRPTSHLNAKRIDAKIQSPQPHLSAGAPSTRYCIKPRHINAAITLCPMRYGTVVQIHAASHHSLATS